jgi:hypothetical protein
MLFALSLALPAFADDYDDDIKGPWITCSEFPKRAQVFGYDYGDSDEFATYVRRLDAVLTFAISRYPTEDSEVQGPEDVEGMIAMRIENDDVDEDQIAINWENAKFSTEESDSAQFEDYPFARAEYQMGQGEDLRNYVSVHVFRDGFRFDVEFSVGADFYEEYAEQIEDWIKALMWAN